MGAQHLRGPYRCHGSEWTQHFSTARAGFVWNANITLVPGVPVRVVDAFVAGEELLCPTTVGTQTVLMPWECRMSNYQTRDGMRVPLTGEALFIIPQGEWPYFRGTIDKLAYEFAP